MRLIYVPCKNQAEAKKIASALVKKRLAFCTNIIPKITSIYRWKGKTETGSESLLLIKTNSSFEKVKKRVEQLHSYEIPAIIELDIEEVNKKYLDWMKKV